MMASNNDNQLQAILDCLAQLEEENTHLKDCIQAAKNACSPQTNGNNQNSCVVTLINSTFGGSNFKPTRFSAFNEFKPYSKDQTAMNPKFDPKRKQVGIDPSIFSGNKADFDKWIIKLADYLYINNCTFKTECD